MAATKMCVMAVPFVADRALLTTNHLSVCPCAAGGFV